MKALLCSVFLVVGLAAPRSGAQVLVGPLTNASNGHAYFLLAATNWTTMESEALALGGHLATVRNATENDWLLSTFNPLTETNNLFIGFTDQELEGQFRWVSGETNTFTNWRAGEPSNSGGHENFAAVRANDGKWNDVVGTLQYGVAEVFGVQTNEVLALSIRTVSAGSLELGWTSTNNHLYRVLWTPNLGTNPWIDFGPYVYGNGSTNHLSDTSTNQPQKFYRVDAIQ